MKKKSLFPKRIKPIKQLCIVLVLMLLVGAAGCGLLPNDSVSPEQDIVILYTNDVHCAVDTGIGYAGLVSLEQEYQAAGAEVLLVDCGDAIQGEPIGTISRGAYIIDIMNEIGIDAAAIGNHEFDYGAERFLELAQHAQFPYVSSNFRYIETGETVFAPYTILEAGGVNIAFVGISTPETLTASAPNIFPGWRR